MDGGKDREKKKKIPVADLSGNRILQHWNPNRDVLRYFMPQCPSIENSVMSCGGNRSEVRTIKWESPGVKIPFKTTVGTKQHPSSRGCYLTTSVKHGSLITSHRPPDNFTKGAFTGKSGGQLLFDRTPANFP